MGAFETGDDEPLPYRPIPVRVSSRRIHFTVTSEKPPPPQTVMVRVAGRNHYQTPFRVRKNSVFDWFEVTPDHGVLSDQTPVRLTITVRPEKMSRPALYRGAFLVRLPDGFSRPVIVYADYRSGSFVKLPGAGTTLYVEAEQPAQSVASPLAGQDDPGASEQRCLVLVPDSTQKCFAEYTFEIPRNGPYLIFARVRAQPSVEGRDVFRVSVDGAPPKRVAAAVSWHWSWVMISNSRGAWNPIQPFQFTKGAHRIRIIPRERMWLDVLVVTDNPRVLFGY
jgi:hypothetical protein